MRISMQTEARINHIGHQPRQQMSLQDWLDLHLNDLETGSTRKINFFFIFLIILSVFGVMLLTLPHLSVEQKALINYVETFFAICFLVEYGLRLYAAPSRWSYLFSAYGMIDLLAIVPALSGYNQAIALRMLRMVAIFRLLKLMRYAHDFKILLFSLRQSIGVLAGVTASIVLIATFMGNIIYAIEPQNFSTSFEGLWWSLVTMSTVGYGDYVPHSLAGRIVAGLCMMLGIAMFAIVTGIITAKIQCAMLDKEEAPCVHCTNTISTGYTYCPHCGQHAPHNNIAPQSTRRRKFSGKRHDTRSHKSLYMR